MKKKVVVGMSGGVDSSVAAALLKEQGYDVIGVTMMIWQNDDPLAQADEGGCCGISAIDDAKRVAEVLDIPHYVMNFRDVFKDKVINYFVDDYLKGCTPNPCIACNRYVKWEALLNRSMEIGADFIATGHYARITELENGRFAIRNSVTATKDQTYALYNLTQDQLSHTLMPVGEYEKDQVREIAKKLMLPVAHKPDSQDICFIPDHDYAAFLKNERGAELPPTGNFVLKDGTVIGQHKGIVHYTVGQRKGLNLSMGHPVFVSEIRPETNEVVIGEGDDVFSTTLEFENINYMGVAEFNDGDEFLAKIRYSHKGEFCKLYKVSDNRFRCEFVKPVRAVTPGQAVVLYKDDYVALGGVIAR